MGDAGTWSLVTELDKSLEMPQQLVEELLFRPELQLENEEDLMNISSRLQAAVEKLLVAINKTTDQVPSSISINPAQLLQKNDLLISTNII